MLKIFVLTLLVLCTAAAIESNFYREESCTKGFCVLENECPHSVDKEFKNLCPNQKKDGAVCCKDFPQDDVNCNQLHNTCMPKCPKTLNLGQKGCPKGESCCVLVK